MLEKEYNIFVVECNPGLSSGIDPFGFDRTCYAHTSSLAWVVDVHHHIEKRTPIDCCTPIAELNRACKTAYAVDGFGAMAGSKVSGAGNVNGGNRGN